MKRFKSISTFSISLFLIIWSGTTSAEYLANQPLPNPGWPGYDLTGAPCQELGQGYGPYDYTNPNHRGHNLEIVEGGHFNKDVEMLIKGKTSSNPWPDIQYTIKAFPNHHRALYAMMRYQLQNSNLKGAIKPAPAECYFQRAIKFKPDDYRVMQLYANYLIKKGYPELAVKTYNRALKIKNAPPEINYSLGLLLLKMNKLDEAVEQAKIAYDGGIKKSKLARKLKEVNRWPIN